MIAEIGIVVALLGAPQQAPDRATVVEARIELDIRKGELAQAVAKGAPRAAIMEIRQDVRDLRRELRQQRRLRKAALT